MNRIHPRNDSKFDREENREEVSSEGTGVDVNIAHSTSEFHCSGINVEDHETFSNLWESTNVLTNSMRLFGQYFESNHHLMSEATKFESSRFSQYYSLFAVILQWMNFARFLTVFTKDNHFDASLFERLQFVLWYGISATMLTCMYAAMQIGKVMWSHDEHQKRR